MHDLHEDTGAHGEARAPARRRIVGFRGAVIQHRDMFFRSAGAAVQAVQAVMDTFDVLAEELHPVLKFIPLDRHVPSLSRGILRSVPFLTVAAFMATFWSAVLLIEFLGLPLGMLAWLIGYGVFRVVCRGLLAFIGEP